MTTSRETKKENSIRLRLQQLLVRTAIGFLRGLKFTTHGLRLFFVYGFGKPSQWLGQGIFRIGLLPFYKQYLKSRQRIKTHPRLAGIRTFGHFLERYAVYATLVSFGVLALTNNIFARTVRPDEIGRGAIWASLNTSEAGELIVETAPKQQIASPKTPFIAIGGTTQQSEIGATAKNKIQDDFSDSSFTAIGGDSNPGTDNIGAANRQETIAYIVQAGDTLSTIAHSYQLTSKTLIWANGMSDGDFIKPGQSLKIPPVEGYLYTVKKGDTLAAIIKKYGGEQNATLDANHLATAEAIQPGEEIIIPDGEPPAPPAPTPAQRRQSFSQVFGGKNSGNAPPSAPSSRSRFIWPTSNHKLNQYFRGRYHTGIDVEGTYSSPIYAAAAGRVVYAAFDRSGYGLHVVIDHGNGYETLYGHASKIFVGRGDSVRQGQTIAMVGSTGRSTGTHLHYEIRVGGGFLNPLSFY